ncbi:MAG TPA: DUF4032 domain-containing protein [Bacillota bacterium]|nr:DUF4032 domain-containing protein [Bacillota bacterium]
MPKSRVNEFENRTQLENLIEVRFNGIQEIPVDRIVGSVGRWRDFDQRFLPADADQKKLWNILNAIEQGIALPAIKVYRIKNDYYVIDGNHRVAAAKNIGQSYIDAEVSELLPPGDTPEQLLWREKSKFEWLTGLSLNFTVLGSYARVVGYIKEYQQQLNQTNTGNYSLKEAARQWGHEVYQPVVTLLEQSRLGECFPDHTPDDLFLYILYHQMTKAKMQGREIGLEEAMAAFGRVHPDQIESWIQKLFHGFVYQKKCDRLCRTCADNCPEGLICLDNGRIKIDEKCQGCGACSGSCPDQNLVPYGAVVSTTG